jgi:TP901 family phage tail tape measure protein
MAGKKFSIQAIFSALDKISAPIAKIRTKLATLGKGASVALRGANAAVDKSIAGLGRFSNAIGVGAVVSVAGLGVALTDTMQKGIAFEASLIRAGAALEVPVRKGTKGFALLEDAALKVGATTEHSSLKAAVALNDLATAGYSAEQSIGAVFKIADFASAGTLELADATNIASGTLASFGLRVADATQNTANMGRVMDVLVKAANDSNASVSELYETIKKGGATASAAGANIEQFLGAANVLATSGLKGELAGTGLANVFIRLAKQTPVAAKEMKQYGITVKKSKDGSIDMVATLGNFQKGLSKLGKSQRVAAVNTIFGESAGNAFLKLIEAGPEKLKAYTESLNDAAGKTAELAAVNRKAVGAQLEIFLNKLENLKLVAFKTLAPLIIKVTDAIGVWITENEKLINSTIAEWLTKISDSLPEIWTWTVRAAKAFAGFLAAAVAVKAINVAILAYEVTAKLAAGATWLWNAATQSATLFNLRLAGEILALKVAQLAGNVATAAATSATWLYNAAITVGRIGTTRFTVAAIASKVAQYASQVATVAVTAAVWLYEAAQTALALVTGRVTVATVAGKVAQVASSVATWAASTAQTAYAIVVGTTSGALGVFSAAAYASVTAIVAQAAALAPFIITIGAAAAAVAALALAWSQISKLSAELSGSGGIMGTIGKMAEMGTLNPFEAHDAAMNEKARKDRAEREKPQIVSPQARAASEAAEANASASVNGKITVAAAPGSKATVQSKSSAVPLRVAQSGAF